MRYAVLPDNYKQISQKRWVFAGKMYSPIRSMDQWSFWSWFDVNRSIFDEDICEKYVNIFVPSDLDLWPLILELHYHNTLAYVVTLPKKNKSFECKLCDRQTDGYTNITKTKHFCWCENVCSMGVWSFCSRYNVHRSISVEDIRKIFTFSFPVTLTFDLLTLNVLP